MKKVYKSVLFVMMANAAMAQSQYFTPTKYRGAFAPAPTAQWTDVWTNWDPQTTNYNPTGKTIVDVTGNITTNTTWSSSKIYRLKGQIYITNGATLTITAGTVVMGDKTVQGACLVATRGSKLVANGTKTSPIVFTSDQAPNERAKGDWGGIILLGNASNNIPEDVPKGIVKGIGNIEGIAATSNTKYGGTDDTDNSGSLKYVRIEFAGYAYALDKEINGLTMGSVGSGTVLENIQVSYSNDDSYEWFGGTVNAKYLIAYRGVDDDFDTDFGYRGNVQFALGVRDPQIADVVSGGASNFFESDNDGGGSDNTPLTSAVFSNVTCVGPLRGDLAASTNANHNRALHIRRNSRLKVLNSVFMDPKKFAVNIDGSKSQTQYLGDNLVVSNNVIAGYNVNKLSEAAGATTENKSAILAKLGTQNDTLPASTSGILTTPYNFTAPDYRPAVGSVALSGSNFTHSVITSLVKTLPATQLKSTSRNAVLTSMSALVFADAVSGANGYRFKITDVNTNAVETYDATVYYFSFSKLLSNKKFNTTYSVEVAPIYGAVVQNYGSPYNVTTASASTTISNALCDNQMDKYDDIVLANRVIGVSKYRFFVDNGSGLRDSLETTSFVFRFASIFSKNPALAKYATTYNVSVKTLADGIWTPESVPCAITLAPLPVLSFTNPGSTFTSNLQLAILSKVYGASYKVYLYNANDELIDSSAVSTSNYFRFSSFNTTKLNTATANGVYQMAAKYLFDGVWSNLSEKATYTRALPTSLATNSSTTVAFPNPFNTSFAIVIDSESNEKVNVSISDLTGKIVEVATLEAQNVSSSVLGEHLTPGVYTITVKQGTFVEKIKAIKTEK